ncbi:hypothetical protein QMK19_07210 [Streptomyces sp. H10-C2]|uniref:hypothetical protein n=1 Tax=unclassified Streptomyces TaxID=2593676 RepID=UPI0024BA30BC|nr:MULTISPECIES: hypothetical protein [unclassified Streptomyces]MDJ0341182.1 hypothetical protein [Streptomyces sp. PH10-H1]MDJ0369465.1 hypothetical protein [Streptomyces sp. H10-C2]
MITPDQACEQSGGEIDDAVVALQLIDPHECEVARVPVAQPQSTDGVQAAGGGSGMVQQVTERDVRQLIYRLPDLVNACSRWS